MSLLPVPTQNRMAGSGRIRTLLSGTVSLSRRGRRRLAYLLLAAAALPQTALADLPTVSDPQNGNGGSGLYGTLQGYFADAIVLLGLLLAASAFVVVGGGALGKFNEARQRNEWGGFAAVVIIGVVLIVMIIWLANKSADIL